MRPMLTVASSLTPHLPWWRNVSMPSAMVEKAISMVARNIAERAPRSGVVVVIRTPGATRAEDQRPGWADPMLAWPLSGERAAMVML